MSHERKALEEELTRQAFYDPLTDLPNRALFVYRLKQALARAARREEHVAVLFLDLDDFKAINDNFGHDVGDRLLSTLGGRLRSCVRSEDMVARLGGDEFTVLLEAGEDAVGVAERIVGVLQAPISLGMHTLTVTASVGIALSSSGQDRAEVLLRAADTAMYRAKKSGKACWETFCPTIAKAFECLELENYDWTRS